MDRTGLYIMVFFILIHSCTMLDKITEIERLLKNKQAEQTSIGSCE